MLKVRVIGVLLIKNGLVVQSIGFSKYLPVGRPDIAVEFLNRWGIDEIVVLDIDATAERRTPHCAVIADCARYCNVPLTVGGGIRDTDGMIKVMHAGADKVVINSAAVTDPKVITEGARFLGNQCMVISIDAVRHDNGEYEVFMHSAARATGYTPVQLAEIAQAHGAGEILLNSVDRDGSKKGYDLELIKQVMKAVDIPVIACGGVSHPNHFLEAIDLGVSAVAAANFFHYSEQSVILVKQYLKSKGKNIRLDSYSTYMGAQFDNLARIMKAEDDVLEKLRFEYIPEEVI